MAGPLELSTGVFTAPARPGVSRVYHVTVTATMAQIGTPDASPYAQENKSVIIYIMLQYQ